MKEKKNISKQVVWKYSSKNNTTFYSTIGSSAQRLANGNTFICSMNDGHFFEVAPGDTNIVWEYISPVTRGGIKKIKVDNYPTYNAAFRAYRYSKDHPAFAGKDLSPQKTITGSDPDYFIPSDIQLSVNNPKGNLPREIASPVNYPNPFTNSTTLDFEVKEPGHVSIIIYNLLGNPVKLLVDEKRNSGKYSLDWDGTDNNGNKLASGTYFCIFVGNNQNFYKKMIFNK